jgi:hypothetical protein
MSKNYMNIILNAHEGTLPSSEEGKSNVPFWFRAGSLPRTVEMLSIFRMDLEDHKGKIRSPKRKVPPKGKN